MERAAAIKKLGKMLGKNFGYRIDPKAPTADERDEARARLPALIDARQQAEKSMHERRDALLAADMSYQELVAAWKEAKERTSAASSITRHYKITVGTLSSMFFHVRAEGDSWEDVIEKLNKESGAAADHIKRTTT